MATGYEDLMWTHSPSIGRYLPVPTAWSSNWGQPELVRYEKVVQTIVQHIEVFLCDHCGAKWKEFHTKCPNCGALLSGRKETL